MNESESLGSAWRWAGLGWRASIVSVSNDLDTLLTALYVDLDDRVLPAIGCTREHRPGRKPDLCDAELICLAVAQQLLGLASARRWIRYARKHLIDMFPDLIGASGYGKRLRAQGGLLTAVITELARDGESWHGLLRLATPPPLPCGTSRETVKRLGPGRATPATATAPRTPGSSGDSGST